MGDTPDPIAGDSIPTARPAVDDVPFARPVTLPQSTEDRPQADELILATTTAGAAWADMLAFFILMILLELLAGAAMSVIVGIPPGPTDLDVEHRFETIVAPRRGTTPTESALNRTLLLPTLAIRAVGSLGIIALILIRRGQSVRSVGLRRRGFPINCLVGVAATLVAYGLILLSTAVLWLVWPGLLDQMTENAERIMDMVPRLHPLAFAGVAAMIGVYEELVFRGFLMVRLRRASGSWTVAVLVTTAIFTALHAVDQTQAALVSVTILSLVFSVVTIWRRSIVPAIVAHALFDLSQFIFLYVTAGEAWT